MAEISKMEKSQVDNLVKNWLIEEGLQFQM